MALAATRDTRMDVSGFRLWAEGRPEHERWELLDGAATLPELDGAVPVRDIYRGLTS
ncbi:hypothetical protein ACRAWG_24310 [Methylobacterium sp. P31]